MLQYNTSPLKKTSWLRLTNFETVLLGLKRNCVSGNLTYHGLNPQPYTFITSFLGENCEILETNLNRTLL